MRQEINGLKVGVGELKGEVRELRGEVGELRGEVGGLRGEVGEFRGEVGGLKGEVGELKGEVGGLRGEVGELRGEVGGLKGEVGELNMRTGTVESRLTTVETTVRNIAVIVSGHTEAFVRVEKQLTKLDELDGLKKSLEIFTSEIIASRHSRTLTDKSFSDQQSMLTDHELRLTRIELRGKQS